MNCMQAWLSIWEAGMLAGLTCKKIVYVKKTFSKLFIVYTGAFSCVTVTNGDCRSVLQNHRHVITTLISAMESLI
jgi:hypothetical protein